MITGYQCKLCDVMHCRRDVDGLFDEHYEANHQPPRPLTKKELARALDAMNQMDG